MTVKQIKQELNLFFVIFLQVEENIRNITDFGQMTTNIGYPLTIPNEIFQF